MNNIGLDTSSFWKFICTLSLLVFAFCVSFEPLFLFQYNEKMNELNEKKAKLAAKSGYYTGLTNNLFQEIKDSLPKDQTQYFYYTKNTKNNSVKSSRYPDTVVYYSNNVNNPEIKAKIDSLNLLNYNYAEGIFLGKSYTETQQVLEKNIKSRTLITIIAGIISLIVFFISLFCWYKKENKNK